MSAIRLVWHYTVTVHYAGFVHVELYAGCSRQSRFCCVQVRVNVVWPTVSFDSWWPLCRTVWQVIPGVLSSLMHFGLVYFMLVTPLCCLIIFILIYCRYYCYTKWSTPAINSRITINKHQTILLPCIYLFPNNFILFNNILLFNSLDQNNGRTKRSTVLLLLYLHLYLRI